MRLLPITIAKNEKAPNENNISYKVNPHKYTTNNSNANFLAALTKFEL